jgi:hypothetical protein
MYRRLSTPDYIVYGLLVIGIVASFLHNPGPLLIPLLVFGVIFLLYKFPPSHLRRQGKVHVTNRKPSPGQQRRQDKERRKSSFRVIYGNKPDSEEEPPRYH